MDFQRTTRCLKAHRLDMFEFITRLLAILFYLEFNPYLYETAASILDSNQFVELFNYVKKVKPWSGLSDIEIKNYTEDINELLESHRVNIIKENPDYTQVLSVICNYLLTFSYEIGEGLTQILIVVLTTGSLVLLNKTILDEARKGLENFLSITSGYELSVKTALEMINELEMRITRSHKNETKISSSLAGSLAWLNRKFRAIFRSSSNSLQPNVDVSNAIEEVPAH